MRWDLYLGPVAEDIPYHPIYHPFNWRGWLDFGAGALGDMGAHLIDHPFWALGLTYPTSIEATSSPFGTMTIPGDPNAPEGSPARRNRSKPVSYPLASTVHYQFAARGNRAAGEAALVATEASIRRVPTCCPTTGPMRCSSRRAA